MGPCNGKCATAVNDPSLSAPSSSLDVSVRRLAKVSLRPSPPTHAEQSQPVVLYAQRSSLAERVHPSHNEVFRQFVQQANTMLVMSIGRRLAADSQEPGRPQRQRATKHWHTAAHAARAYLLHQPVGCVAMGGGSLPEKPASGARGPWQRVLRQGTQGLPAPRSPLLGRHPPPRSWNERRGGGGMSNNRRAERGPWPTVLRRWRLPRGDPHSPSTMTGGCPPQSDGDRACRRTATSWAEYSRVQSTCGHVGRCISSLKKTTHARGWAPQECSVRGTNDGARPGGIQRVTTSRRAATTERPVRSTSIGWTTAIGVP